MTHRDETDRTLELSRYWAVRSITMAVAAFSGLILASVTISAIVIFVVADDPFSYPAWVDSILGFLGVGGAIWFVSLLVMSINALRRHMEYHKRIVSDRNVR